MDFNNYESLVQASEELITRGFNRKFKFDDGKMLNLADNKKYTPEELKIVEYHRFEGINNPADSTIIFAVEAIDSSKGTVIMNYSADADMNLVSFIDKVKIKLSSESTYKAAKAS